MRFTIEQILLGTDHPNFPGKSYWKILDNKLKHYRLGMYTSEREAEKYCNKLNSERTE